MDYVWASLLILLLGASQIIQIFGGPANWIALALVAFWKWLFPESMGWGFVLILGILAAAGEALEFGLQMWSAGRYGAGKRGNIGGMIGAIAGAIFGAPFLLGVGALIGALAGAYLGCLIMELPDKDMQHARRAALGAFWGKAFGFTVKMSLGAVMVVLSIPKIWP
ncbi:DUF456 domain-containing protein [Pseudodesulfovibrio tunisiensis]|uniref:DUF456 domain-containing protein n=1 Tax=Pseudodesulfovibrio tunisiensis TaxID=463192 RepID=UPI001FB40BDC|nr:DUF456 domain-containing protein [Pseudodesulfovibrio tunisiensis]